LAKHGITAPKHGGVALVDQKLETLLELGNRITASRIDTKVEVVEADQVEAQEGNIRYAVNFQVSLKLVIESLDGSPSASLPVQYEAQGSLSGEYFMFSCL
jgi:uncharacterized lipoprotein YajG